MRRGGLATALTIGLGVLIGIGAALGLSRTAAPQEVVTPSPSISPATIAPPTTAATSAAPTRTPLPIIISPYSYGGRRYAALTVPVGFMYAAPFAGTVRVTVYQLVGGEIRVGTNVASQPFYPYLTLTSADRRIIYRPGALETDTQLLLQDGAKVEMGTPLFKVAGPGASSWRTFYDSSVTAQLVVSFASLPGDVELDPVPLFGGP